MTVSIAATLILWTNTGLVDEHEQKKVEGNYLAAELAQLDDDTAAARARLTKKYNAGTIDRPEYVAAIDKLAAEHELAERRAVVNAGSVARGRIWRRGNGDIVLRTLDGDRIVGELVDTENPPEWIPEIPEVTAADLAREMRDGTATFGPRTDAGELALITAQLGKIMAKLGLDTDDDAPRVDAPTEQG